MLKISKSVAPAVLWRHECKILTFFAFTFIVVVFDTHAALCSMKNFNNLENLNYLEPIQKITKRGHWDTHLLDFFSTSISTLLKRPHLLTQYTARLTVTSNQSRSGIVYQLFML